ncbi:MAG: polysaccharide biosynthesis/export family protein [Cyclobacteriaceae bacterium]|nr:polysaccharide biosynthesis/export family protein [Cyclobacteriaceae bacterium]
MRLLLFLLCALLTACGSYRQNILFNATTGHVPEKIRHEISNVESDYRIRKNDQLTMDLYSNKGEKLIDPNPELSQENPAGQAEAPQKPIYTLDVNGLVRLPMVGTLNLENLTLRQAEEMLQKEYAHYFKDPYVHLTCANRRVIMLGAPGGQVIALENENMRLPEILALAKGLPNDSKAGNIKLIRGERVFEIDLSTLQGFKEGNMVVESGDIIYVEPIRRPFSESLRDNSGIFSMLISLATLVVVISNLSTK